MRELARTRTPSRPPSRTLVPRWSGIGRRQRPVAGASCPLARAERWRPWRAYAALHLWAAGAALAASSGTNSNSANRGATMSARRPETFLLDRLQTPIGPALLVTDADGVLRAFDWEDHCSRVQRTATRVASIWRFRICGKDARAPQKVRAALSAYFKGDLAALGTIEWRIAGTPFQRKVCWTAPPTIPAGTTMTYGALAAKPRLTQRDACRWARQRLKSNQRRRALPSPDRRQRIAGQIRQRA